MKNFKMKRSVSVLIAAVLLLSLCTVGLTGCGGSGSGSGEYINVLNWGEYIDTDLIDEFEDETGITVNYNTCATCEEMYAKLLNGGVTYDIVCPSDYMVSRMIEEGMLTTVDYSNVPNFEYIDENFKNPEYDPTGEYSVPYQWGRVGIIYNREMVDESDVTGWDILWNEKYAGQILMFDNSRDALGIALKKLGQSYNTTDEAVLNQAEALLEDQKPLVQAYVMDQIFDKMEAGEAAIAPYYVGDYYLMLDELGETADDPDRTLGLYIPEGTNLFVDAWCIPKDTQNKSGAEAFINFMCDPENMAANTEVINYSAPESAAVALLDSDILNNDDMYPSESVLDLCETYINLPENIRSLYDDLWVRLMSA